MQPESPTKNEKHIRLLKMKKMKETLLNIRERKNAIPKVQQPTIVKSFNELTLFKKNQNKKKQLIMSITEKRERINKLKDKIEVYKNKYDAKNESFKEKTHLLKLLTSKLQAQYEKTKQAFLDVQINKTLLNGLRKLCYFRLAQIIFNDQARNVFHAIESQMEASQMQGKSDQEISICIGYLGLLISIVGYIAGSRLWFDFTFKGSKSTIRLNDGTIVMLRPSQGKFKESRNIMIEQLHQIMSHDMGVKISKVDNLYHMCQELSKILMT